MSQVKDPFNFPRILQNRGTPLYVGEPARFLYRYRTSIRNQSLGIITWGVVGFMFLAYMYEPSQIYRYLPGVVGERHRLKK